MQPIAAIWKSTIFQKWIMAVTGLLIVLFLVGHLSGNLLIFLGPEHMNAYGVDLRELLHGSFIWMARIGLVVVFVMHIRSAMVLSARNRQSVSTKNNKVAFEKSTLASRTMLYSGLLIAFYLVYHLAHFTWGMAHSEYYHYVDAMGRHDVYRMVVESFRNPIITVTYVLAMVFTGLHLNHAIQSAFQTLGVNNPRFNGLIRLAGPGVSILLVLGFISVPLSIILGLVK
jgi:succinate dehydrogenase / fumarate reductase, cytochrome b subunit